MGNFYTTNTYTCQMCGGDNRYCNCGNHRNVTTPAQYIADIRRDETSNRVSSVRSDNKVDVWYSSMIRDIDDSGDDLIVTMVTGETHTIPLYKGISENILNDILSGYVTKAELCVFEDKIKDMLEHEYVKQTDFAVIIDNLKCSCKGSCGCSVCDDGHIIPK